jgi:hypothetical protein
MLNATRMLSLSLARLQGMKVMDPVAGVKSLLRMAREPLEQNIHARTPMRRVARFWWRKYSVLFQWLASEVGY